MSSSAKQTLLPNVVEPKALELAFVPDTVEYETNTFTNLQGLKLQSFYFRARDRDSLGVVFMCHGITAHTTWEWLLSSEPKGLHNCWQGSVLQGLVDAGYVVYALDQQSHGYSEGARGLRCFFERFSDLRDENDAFVREVVLKDSRTQGLPLFLFGQSMGGAVAVQMSTASPELYQGMVLYAPMLCVPKVNIMLAAIVKCILALVDNVAPVWRFTPRQKGPAKDGREKDPLVYRSGMRVRVARECIKATQAFMTSDLSSVGVPFLVMHSVADPATNSRGSQELFEKATCLDKTYLKVGPGLDIEGDGTVHALSYESGHDLVLSSALKWLLQRTPAVGKL